MSQNVTIFHVFGTKLRLPFMFGLGQSKHKSFFVQSYVFLLCNGSQHSFVRSFLQDHELSRAINLNLSIELLTASKQATCLATLSFPSKCCNHWRRASRTLGRSRHISGKISSPRVERLTQPPANSKQNLEPRKPSSLRLVRLLKSVLILPTRKSRCWARNSKQMTWKSTD